jgi:hypothetical protein
MAGAAREMQEVAQPPDRLPVPVKRAHNRHYLQQYFTKRAWNIAQHLVRHFTQPGETVLDPFCGAGVIPVEALVLRRRALACDINPWAVFITRVAAMAPVDLHRLEAESNRVIADAGPQIELLTPDSRALKVLLSTADYPRVPLPPVFQAGLTSLDQLFSRTQLGHLVVLRDRLRKVQDEQCRDLLHLAFSITLDRANRMYTARGKSSPFRGQSAPFSIRRYQVWDDATELPVLELFSAACRKVLKAKADANGVLDEFVSERTLRLWQGSATRLAEMVPAESVDYVLTDPPYGRNYNYLDLSLMWNAWLGFSVGTQAYKDEIIQGGSHRKTQVQYRELLSKAIEEMGAALKRGRWLTLIYSESNMETWSWLLATCRDRDLRYVGSTWSGSALPTHKKHQSPYATAAGEFYVHFRKMTASRFATLYGRPMRFAVADPKEVVRLAVEKVIVTYLGASMETISNAVISRQLLGQDFLERHGIGRLDIRDVMGEHFDPNGGRWQVRDLTHVDPDVDPCDLLRYCLFHIVSRAPSPGVDPEGIRRSLPRLLDAYGAQLPLEHIRALLQSFASPSGSGRWVVDDRKMNGFSNLRLFFERSTVDSLRDFLQTQAERRTHARKSIEGIATLTTRLLHHHRDAPDRAVHLALLAEHIAAAMANEFPDAIASIAAVGDLALGQVALDRLRDMPLDLLVTLKPRAAVSEDERFALSEHILGPVLAEHHVWFHPILASASEAEQYAGSRVDLVVS